MQILLWSLFLVIMWNWGGLTRYGFYSSQNIIVHQAGGQLQTIENASQKASVTCHMEIMINFAVRG